MGAGCRGTYSWARWAVRTLVAFQTMSPLQTQAEVFTIFRFCFQNVDFRLHIKVGADLHKRWDFACGVPNKQSGDHIVGLLKPTRGLAKLLVAHERYAINAQEKKRKKKRRILTTGPGSPRSPRKPRRPGGPSLPAGPEGPGSPCGGEGV